MPRAQYDKNAREKDKRYFDRVTKKGFQVLPRNVKKYYGSVSRTKDGKWESSFGRLAVNIKPMLHQTEESAADRVKRIAIRENLPIKNIMYRYKDRHLCVLTQNQIMAYSPQDQDLVEDHTWCAQYDKSVAGYYARTVNTEGKAISFLKLMYPDMKDKESGDHINPMEKLNNTRENTRVASPAIQSINKPLLESNNSGIKGVYHHKTRDCWVAKWSGVEPNTEQTKSFSIAKFGYDVALRKAIKARNKGITQVEKYKIAGVTDVYEPSKETVKEPKVRPEDCLPGVRYSVKDKAWIGEFVNDDGKRIRKYHAGKRDDQCARNEAIKFRKDGMASTGRHEKS